MVAGYKEAEGYKEAKDEGNPYIYVLIPCFARFSLPQSSNNRMPTLRCYDTAWSLLLHISMLMDIHFPMSEKKAKYEVEPLIVTVARTNAMVGTAGRPRQEIDHIC